MRISLEALLVLDAIDRKGSFAAAAEEIHRVPSAITYTIQKLERDLDLSIFDRSGHRAQLTEAGQKLLYEGRHILHAIGELEDSVKRVATGWEAELRIAVGDLIPMALIFDLLEEFHAETEGTQIRLSSEVFGGAWDALVGGGADLIIGAAGEGPLGSDYATQLLGEIEFLFVVAPDHPLATGDMPLTNEKIQEYRAIAAADSSRNLPPRTAALLTGQEVLTVPDMAAKREAQLRGLGVGYIPAFMVRDDIATGRLIRREVQNLIPSPQVFAAWQPKRAGRALTWFLERMEQMDLSSYLGHD